MWIYQCWPAWNVFSLLHTKMSPCNINIVQLKICGNYLTWKFLTWKFLPWKFSFELWYTPYIGLFTWVGTFIEVFNVPWLWAGYFYCCIICNINLMNRIKLYLLCSLMQAYWSKCPRMDITLMHMTVNIACS